MRNNKKKLKLKKIILLILLLIIICLGFIMYNKFTDKIIEKDYSQKDEDAREYLDQRVLPRNIRSLINEYEGNIELDNLYLKLNELIIILDEINNTNDSNYYENNKEKLTNYFGEITRDEFNNFLNRASLNNVEKFKFAEILKDSIISLENYVLFNISLTYENNEEIKFKVYMKNELTNTQKDIIFEYIY